MYSWKTGLFVYLLGFCWFNRQAGIGPGQQGWICDTVLLSLAQVTAECFRTGMKVLQRPVKYFSGESGERSELAFVLDSWDHLDQLTTLLMVSSVLLDLVLMHQLPHLSVLTVCGRCYRIQSQTYCFCFQT